MNIDDNLWRSVQKHARDGRLPEWAAAAALGSQSDITVEVERKTVTRSYLDFLRSQVDLAVSEDRVQAAKSSLNGLAVMEGQDYYQILILKNGHTLVLGLAEQGHALLYVKDA